MSWEARGLFGEDYADGVGVVGEVAESGGELGVGVFVGPFGDVVHRDDAYHVAPLIGKHGIEGHETGEVVDEAFIGVGGVGLAGGFVEVAHVGGMGVRAHPAF